MLYAIAHVRGGGEMGRSWYEKEGKYLMKRNTFTDFVACAEHLIEEGTVLFFRQKFTPEDAIGSHACSLEALTRVWPTAFLSEVHSSYRFAL